MKKYLFFILMLLTITFRVEAITPTCFQLGNHPDGARRPPLYGLRIDELINVTSQLDVFTFDFEHPDSDVQMFISPSLIHIYGHVYGGLDTGSSYGNPSYRGLWDVDFSYDTEIEICGGDGPVVSGSHYDICVNTFNFANHGTIIPRFGVHGGQAVQLSDYRGSFPFSFRLGDEADNQGHRGFAGTSGWGWLQPSGRHIGMESRDWLFVATEIPCTDQSLLIPTKQRLGSVVVELLIPIPIMTALPTAMTDVLRILIMTPTEMASAIMMIVALKIQERRLPANAVVEFQTLILMGTELLIAETFALKIL